MAVSQAKAARTIYVKVLVDEEERTPVDVWKNRLGRRVEAASQVLREYADVQLSVIQFGRWRSDDRITDLNRTLREFEQEVDVAPAQLAIGFSSQYRFHRGRNGMGGTRGPLHSHILLRESAPKITERERLEALVHELGHYLGAAHTKDSRSAMRPVVGDGQARNRQHRIGFDPVNARIIRLVGAELSVLDVHRFADLSPLTRQRLAVEYRQLAQQLPKDPAAKRFLAFLNAH